MAPTGRGPVGHRGSIVGYCKALIVVPYALLLAMSRKLPRA